MNYLLVLLFIPTALVESIYHSIILITFHNLLNSYNQINAIIFIASVVVTYVGMYNTITLGTLLYQISSNYKSILNFLNIIHFDQKVEIYKKYKETHSNHTLVIFEAYIRYQEINKLSITTMKSLSKWLLQINFTMEKISIEYNIHVKKAVDAINQYIDNQIVYYLDKIGIKDYFEKYVHDHKIFSKINREFINRSILDVSSDLSDDANDKLLIKIEKEIENNVGCNDKLAGNDFYVNNTHSPDNSIIDNDHTISDNLTIDTDVTTNSSYIVFNNSMTGDDNIDERDKEDYGNDECDKKDHSNDECNKNDSSDGCDNIECSNIHINNSNDICGHASSDNMPQKLPSMEFPPGLAHSLNKSFPSFDHHTFGMDDDTIKKLQEKFEEDFKKGLEEEFGNFDYNDVKYDPNDEKKLDEKINNQLKELDGLSKMFQKLVKNNKAM